MTKILAALENQFEMNVKEDVPHFGRWDDIFEEWYWTEEDYIESLEYDIDWPDDPAALAAEMKQWEEYIENLFEIRKEVLQDLLEIEKLLPAAEYDDYEFLRLDASDCCYLLELFDKQLEYII